MQDKNVYELFEQLDIKRYSDNMLVAVRMDSKGKLLFRTMYTITDSQLSDYLRKGSAWEFVLDK